MKIEDPILKTLVRELIDRHRCHTVILYGSRARGDATEKSDYDVAGIKKNGKSHRVTGKRRGRYLDVFVFPESHFAPVTPNHLYMNGGKVLFDANGFGARLVKRLEALARRPQKPLPPDEIEMLKVWSHKMLDRSLVGDIEGNFRRVWLQMSLVETYFLVRGKRYSGSKVSFEWLKTHDPAAYRLFDKVLKEPLNRKALIGLVEKVTRRKHR